MNDILNIAGQYGIWCACFLGLALYTLKHYEKLVIETKEDSKTREEQFKKENNDREIRYINTINNITEKVNDKIDKIDIKVDKIQEEVCCLKERK